MGINNHKKLTKTKGFTIIEVMIVLAIAGLIMVIVFLAVPALQKNVRDAQRKSYAREVLASVEEFQSDNMGVQINCFGGSLAAACTNAPVEAGRFISRYMPDEDDPSTGVSYRSDTTQDVQTTYCHGQATPSQSTVFCWDDRAGNYVLHTITPDVGQIYIVPVHVCGSNTSSQPYGDRNIRDGVGYDPFNPDATGSNPPFVISVLIGTETGQYYCVNS